jgi:dolichol-phosphate mannosyltransferase
LEVEISVVVPVYKCAECIRHLHDRLTVALQSLGESYEIVFVDDRSPDDAWAVLRDLATADPAVRVVRLSRNFGQHAAITAGIAESNGNWVVVMDCDLQDPPEVVPRLYAATREGYDIVFARRRIRRQPLSRRAANRAYFFLRKTLSRVDLETEHANLSIMSRKAADSFLRLRDTHRNFLLILYWLGYEHTSIEFDHADRYAGKSSYTLRGLVRVASDGLFFHTTVLLRWIVFAGFAISISACGLAVFFVTSHFTHHSYPGWTSVVVLLLLLGGFIIMSTGVAALYIGKVFEQVKERPLYIVDERIGAGEGGASTTRMQIVESKEEIG